MSRAMVLCVLAAVAVAGGETEYEQGKRLFGKRDYAGALRWFRKAAEAGHLDATYSVGTAYHYGRGARLNHAEAIKWYRVAADRGHLRAANNLGEVLASFDKILIPELNTGQLLKIIRAEFLIDATGLNKVAGEPFRVTEIEDKIQEMSA